VVLSVCSQSQRETKEEKRKEKASPFEIDTGKEKEGDSFFISSSSYI
jgi:hypothetical protein